MAQILKKFLFFPSVASYEAVEDDILNTSIVFVNQPEVKTGNVVTTPAQKFIVTHGIQFNTDFDPAAIEAEIDALDGRLDTLEGNASTSGSVAYAVKQLENTIIGLLGGSSAFANTSGNTVKDKIDAVSTKVDNLDYTIPNASHAAGRAVTAVTQTNGKIAVTEGDIAAAHVTVADSGNLFTGTTVEAVLAEIDAAYKALVNNLDYTIPSHTAGKAVTAVTQTNGKIAVTEGNVDSSYVTYTPSSGNTVNTDVQSVLTELFTKIGNTQDGAEIAVYKGSVAQANKSATISADGNDYIITQGSTTIATLNIAKDMVISGGEVITADGTEKKNATENAGLTVGQKYVKLTIKNSADIIYIPVNALYKDHTGFTGSKIKIEIDDSSGSNVIKGSVITGSLEKTDLTTTLQNEITSARTTIATKSTGHVRVSKTAGTGATADNYTISENDIASANYVGTIPSGATATDVVGYAQELANGLLGTSSDTAANVTIYGARAMASAAAQTALTTRTEINPKSTGHVTISVTQSSVDSHDVVTISENDIASAALVGTIPSGAKASTVTGYAAEVAEDAKDYADGITVNSQSQDNSQNITVTGAHINVTGYTERTNAANTDVKATDTVNAAIKKVETKVDNLSAGSPFEYTNSTNKSTILSGSGLSAQNVSEVAVGRYNNSVTGSTAAEKTAFSVGNGTGASAKSNAFEVRADGSLWINYGSDYSKLQTILSNEIDWYEGA